MGIGMVLWVAGIGFLAYWGCQRVLSGFGRYEQRYLESADAQLRASDIYMTSADLLRISWVAGLAGGGLGLFWGMSLSLLVMLLLSGGVGLLGFHLPRLVLHLLTRRRLAHFEAQLPDGVDLLNRSLKAGRGLGEAFRIGATELGAPISQEFAVVVRDTQLGRPLGGAVWRMARRMDLEDTRLLAVVVELGMLEGGNMTEALGAVAETVRNRFNVRRRVKAATASARAQLAVVASMPFVILGIFALTNPEMVEPLWHDRLGWFMIGLVIVLEIIGVLVMIRIAKKVEY